MSQTYTDVMLRNLDASMATGIQPDGLWIFGDMAFKTATVCSPPDVPGLDLAGPQSA